MKTYSFGSGQQRHSRPSYNATPQNYHSPKYQEITEFIGQGFLVNEVLDALSEGKGAPLLSSS